MLVALSVPVVCREKLQTPTNTEWISYQYGADAKARAERHLILFLMALGKVYGCFCSHCLQNGHHFS